MDPNATLAAIREITGRDEHADPELAELVDALDQWLSKGGFLPAAWQR